MPTDREALQSLGQRLITRFGPAGFVDWVIDHSPDTPWGEALTLDGVRHVGVYSRLRDLFPQHVLVYCSVDPQVQIQRIMARDGLDLKAATRIAGHPTETEVHELHSLAAATWNASTAAIDIELVLSAVAGSRDAP